MQGEFVRPEWLRAGDLVRIVAPAGPFDRALFFRGAAFLKSHFRVEFEADCRARTGFLAGSRERRLAELNRALRCPEAKAVVAARGGVGCGEIACQADFAALKQVPKWLVGFSDVTALHAEAQRHGVQSLHAGNVTSLGVGAATERESWLAAVSGASALAQPLEGLTEGVACGPIVGGNLCLVEACVAQGRFVAPPGGLLFLEEIAERPYRIDRLLTSLGNAGALDALEGLVLGHFTGCQPGADGTSVTSIVRKHAERHALACARGLNAGHDTPNVPLYLGAKHELRVNPCGEAFFAKLR